MARVNVTCPSCSTSYAVEESVLGRKGRCKRCQTSFVLSRWSVGQVFLDDFVVERLLGAGGMGAVYLVRSRSSGQPFALKTVLASRFADPVSRRNFLDELQTWIDLPEHPHLAACRFFRTVGDEIAIFAEYVAGGSLADWIRERKLTRLEGMLDVAIQFAWGLHAAHEHGLVHQDVKPANVLLTPEGVAKVADFGLARARAVAGERAAAGPGQSVLVSAGGMTPAYCSPEQAEGRPLSRKTDVWSWGLSVLEMFTGEVTWQTGQAAPDVLEACLESGPEDARLARLPADLAEVLRRCFRQDPAGRWAKLDDAAQALWRLYREAAGKEYSRQAPAVRPSGRHATVTYDRRTVGGATWADPREWLRKAVREAGRSAAEVEALLPARQGSRRAQAIADLAAYEEARRIFERLVARGRQDLEEDLATLCMEKASVHQDCEDWPGAATLYDRAIALWERLLERGDGRHLRFGLAVACMNQGARMNELGDNRAAVALYDRAISIAERLVEQEGRRELRGDLALFCRNKAVAMNDLGDKRAALALYDRAITLYERLVVQEGRRELQENLALACLNEAIAVNDLGDKRAAVALYDRAVTLYERLVEQEGRRELAGDLAWGMVNRAETLLLLGRREQAQTDARTAVRMLRSEIARTGHADLQRVLDYATTALKELL
jgi:predicted Zn finger-like uncharacterized protein